MCFAWSCFFACFYNYNMESLSSDPVSLEATPVGSNFRSPQRCRHETAIYDAVRPMHAACKMIIALVLKRTYNLDSLLKYAPMLSMSCGSPPLEPEDSRFVLPGQSNANSCTLSLYKLAKKW